MKARNKSMPSLGSDAAAEHFVASADLSEYDLSGFKPMRFEIEPKSAALNMRLPVSLLDAVKARTKARAYPTRVMCGCCWKMM
ncbi:MAG: CopG family antitoxin [Novosphingobium sp.]